MITEAMSSLDRDWLSLRLRCMMHKSKVQLMCEGGVTARVLAHAGVGRGVLQSCVVELSIRFREADAIATDTI